MRTLKVTFLFFFLLLSSIASVGAQNQECVFDSTGIEIEGIFSLREKLSERNQLILENIDALAQENSERCSIVRFIDGDAVLTQVNEFTNGYLDTSDFVGYDLTQRGRANNSQLIFFSIQQEELNIGVHGGLGEMGVAYVDSDIDLHILLTDDVEKVEVIWDGDMESVVLENFVAGSQKAMYSIGRGQQNIKSGFNKYLVRAYAKGRVYEDVISIRRNYSFLEKNEIDVLTKRIGDILSNQVNIKSIEGYKYLTKLEKKLQTLQKAGKYTGKQEDVVNLITATVSYKVKAFQQNDEYVWSIEKNKNHKNDILQYSKITGETIVVEKNMTALDCVDEWGSHSEEPSEILEYWKANSKELTGYKMGFENVYYCINEGIISLNNYGVRNGEKSETFQTIIQNTPSSYNDPLNIIQGKYLEGLSIDAGSIKVKYLGQDGSYIFPAGFGDAGCQSNGYYKIDASGAKEEIYRYGSCYNHETGESEFF